ncbi:GNAT family protein [soil metagenome]
MSSTAPVPAIDVRFASPADASLLLDLKLVLDRETTFMMYEPGERKSDILAVERDIRRRIESTNSTSIVAAAESEIAGYVEAEGGEFRRNRHSAMVTAGVRRVYAGQGLGSRLFQALIDWADGAGVIRLELTVMTHNVAAAGLYRKFGFLPEGVRSCSLRVDGKCVDEIAMARARSGFAETGRKG